MSSREELAKDSHNEGRGRRALFLGLLAIGGAAILAPAAFKALNIWMPTPGSKNLMPSIRH
jgi:hypothetical protein